MRNNSCKILFYLLGITFLLLLWWIGHLLKPDTIPSIQVVLEMLINKEHTRTLYGNLGATCENALWGLLISCVIAFILVVIVCLLPNSDFFINPMASFIQVTPVVALVPIFMIFFKTSGSYIAASIAISFFPLYNAGIDGIERVPERLTKLANVYNTNRWHQFLYFKKGYILESMASALKTSAPLSVVGAMVGEYVAGGDGGSLLFFENTRYSLGIFFQSNTSASMANARFCAMILSFIAGIAFYFVGYFIHQKYEKDIRISKQ